MMRTTLDIDDDLLALLKQQAAVRGGTLQALCNALLRQAILRQSQTPPFVLELRGWDGRLQPGADLNDRDKLFDLMDGR